jgi:chromosome segregation ATPase
MKNNPNFGIEISNKTANKSKLLTEIEEKIRKQELAHESELKSLKSEISGLKNQINDSYSTQNEYLKDIRSRYEAQIQSQKQLIDTQINDQKNNLKQSLRVLQDLQKDFNDHHTTFSRIKLSFDQEVNSIINKKKSLTNIYNDLDAQIKTIQSKKIPELKHELKKIKSNCKKEIKSLKYEHDIATKDLILENSYKNELLNQLESSLIDIKHELNQITSSNQLCIKKLRKSLKETDLESENLNFAIKKLSRSHSSFISNKLEDKTSAKTKMLEQFKSVNLSLRERSIKLNKYLSKNI